MKSITIHGLDDALDRELRRKAREEGLSLNKTIKRLLTSALGVPDTPTDRRCDFQDLFATWSQADLEAFDRATSEFGCVSPADWQ